LVRARTQLINHVRGAVKSVGGRVPRFSAPAFAAKAPPYVPDGLHPALAPLLELIATLTRQLHSMERTLTEVGVGPLTALCYVLTLEDPARFRCSRTVGAYLGLCPRRRDSGAYQPQLRITKRGDGMLRRYLVNAAHYILGPFGPDCDLRRWGLLLAERGGGNAKKRAVIAVARKLATLLHRLWVTGAVYEPLRRAEEGGRDKP
jgi:transposase